MTRAWSALLGAAILAPLVTWLPMLAHRAPWTGLPAYQPAQGIDLWQMQTLWLGLLLCIAALVAEDDRWLALAVVTAGFTLFWRGARLDPTHAVLFALGALGLWSLRRMPLLHAWTVRTVLCILGAFEAIYVIQQSVFQYDVLWNIWGGARPPIIQPLGTLGTVDAAGAYIAMTAPLMPLWFLPVSIYAVWCSKSLGATAALAVGLGVLVLRARTRLALVALAVGTIPLAIIAYYKVWIGTATVAGRLTVQWLGLKHAAATSPILGWGLGGWAQTVPAQQMQQRVLPSGELFREAHSEPIQWACETGVFGLVLLAGWLWTHRAMFAHPTWGASIAAAGVSSAAFFPLHTVSTALVILLLVGLATPARTTLHPVPGG
jgi:hypothetical protein